MLNEKNAVAALNHIKRIEKRLRTRNDKMARWNTDENKTYFVKNKQDISLFSLIAVKESRRACTEAGAKVRCQTISEQKLMYD